MALNASSKSFGLSDAPTSRAASLKRAWRSASVIFGFFFTGDLRAIVTHYHNSPAFALPFLEERRATADGLKWRWLLALEKLRHGMEEHHG